LVQSARATNAQDAADVTVLAIPGIGTLSGECQSGGDGSEAYFDSIPAFDFMYASWTGTNSFQSSGNDAAGGHVGDLHTGSPGAQLHELVIATGSGASARVSRITIMRLTTAPTARSPRRP
jgi:hypothetical protein